MGTFKGVIQTEEVCHHFRLKSKRQVFNIRNTYKNILELITINENVKYECESNLRIYEKFFLKAGPAGYSKGTSYQDYDTIHGSKPEIAALELETIITSMDKLRELIQIQEIILDNLYDAKAIIDNKLSILKGIPYQLAYLKLVEGYSIKRIMEQLHISESYAMKLSAKV